MNPHHARILALHGELDSPKKQALRDALCSIAESPLAIVDLSDVGRLDLTALAEFVRVMTSAQTRGDRLLWVTPSGSPVREALMLAKLDRYFELFDSLAEARKAVAA